MTLTHKKNQNQFAMLLGFVIWKKPLSRYLQVRGRLVLNRTWWAAWLAKTIGTVFDIDKQLFVQIRGERIEISDERVLKGMQFF